MLLIWNDTDIHAYIHMVKWFYALCIKKSNKIHLFVICWNNSLMLVYCIKLVLVFLILFQCHQESGQFNIVSVLLSIIFKHNLKLLSKTETFCQILPGLNNSSKVPFGLVRGIINSYPLRTLLLSGTYLNRNNKKTGINNYVWGISQAGKVLELCNG